MEFGAPEPLEPEIEIREDTPFPIQFNDEGRTYYFMERWDRAVRFRKIGAYCLKIFDNEDGLVEGWTNEDDFNRVLDYTGADPHDRETMTEAEYEGFKKSKENE